MGNYNLVNMKVVSRASRELGITKDQVIALAEMRVRMALEAKTILTRNGFGLSGLSLRLVGKGH